MKKDFLIEMLNTVSVTGKEEPNQEVVLKYGKTFADKQIVDPAGNVINVVNPKAKTKVLLCGHIDEIGFIVTHIDDKGMVHVQSAGGVSRKLYIGAPMQIIHETKTKGKVKRTKVQGVGVVNSDLLKKEKLENTDIIIDIGANKKEEAEKLVSIGDAVVADTTVRELLNDNFSCRAMDDKTGAFVITEAAKKAKKMGAKIGIYANTVTGEETGVGGAYFASSGIEPTCAIVVDVTDASDYPGMDPARGGDKKIGGGPVLCHSGMLNKKLNALLEDIAKEKEIPIQWEVSSGNTYTDSDTVFKTVKGIPVALISIPLRYMHSSVELGNWKDLENCIDLIAEALLRIDDKFDFNPL